MLLLQTIEDSLDRVPLFFWGCAIRLKNIVDGPLKRLAKTAFNSRLAKCVGLGSGLLEYLANLESRMSKRSSDLSNAHSISMGQPNASVIVHVEHLSLASC